MHQLSFFSDPNPDSGPESDHHPSDRLPEIIFREGLNPGAVFALGNHRLLCGNSLKREEVHPLLNGQPVKAVITDPPYGIKMDKWDDGILSDDLIQMWHEITSDQCFVAFFGQMPTLLDWCNTVSKYFKFKDHISWAKRNISGICLELLRTHESIMIYRKTNPKYFVTKGPFEDVKVPGLLFDVATIQGIERYISNLKTRIKTGKDCVQHNFSKESSHSIYQRYKVQSSQGTDEVNFTNLWSFLPENATSRNDKKLSHHHPTVKPILLMNRLVELLADTGDIVFDPFLGSGTTLLSCENTGRICYGVEKDVLFCEVILQRWEKLTDNKAVKVSQIN